MIWKPLLPFSALEKPHERASETHASVRAGMGYRWASPDENVAQKELPIMPLTNAEKQKAHRRRMAEKMARLESALRAIQLVSIWGDNSAFTMREIAYKALNPTDPAKS